MRALLVLISMLLILPNLYADCGGYTADSSVGKQCEACQKQAPNKIWDTKLNRCVKSADALEKQKEFQTCEAMTDATAKKTCLEGLMNKALDKKGYENPEEVKSIGGTLEKMILGAMIVNIATKGGLTSSCMSAKVLAGVGVASILHEVMMNKKHKAALEDLKNKYSEVTKDKSAYNAQIKVFEYLKNSQELLRDLTEDKAKHYKFTALGYGAAAATALVETSSSFGMKPCTAASPAAGASPVESAPAVKRYENFIPTDLSFNTPTFSPFTIEMYDELMRVNRIEKNSENHAYLNKIILTIESGLAYASPINDALAADKRTEETQKRIESDSETKYGQILMGTAAGAALGYFLKPYLSSSLAIAGLSAGAGLLSYQLSDAYSGESEKAKNNIKKIEEIIATFKSTMENLCPNGRENLKEPKCYCMTVEGKRNKNRENSDTCKQFWANLDLSYYVRGDVYGRAAAAARKGCVMYTGQFDLECRCKSMINTQTKENGCMKVTMTNMNLGNFGKASLLNDTLGHLNQAYAGNITSGFGKTSAGGQGARNKDLVDSMTKQANDKLIKEGKQPIPSPEAMAQKILSNPEIQELLKNGIGSELNPTNAMLAYAPKDEASKEILKEALQKTGMMGEDGSGKGLRGGAKATGTGPNFNYAAPTSGNSQATAMNFEESTMNKNYNYKENDINNNEDTPIWNIISSRYMNSGLRRLFDEEKKQE